MVSKKKCLCETATARLLQISTVLKASRPRLPPCSVLASPTARLQQGPGMTVRTIPSASENGGRSPAAAAHASRPHGGRAGPAVARTPGTAAGPLGVVRGPGAEQALWAARRRGACGNRSRAHRFPKLSRLQYGRGVLGHAAASAVQAPHRRPASRNQHSAESWAPRSYEPKPLTLGFFSPSWQRARFRTVSMHQARVHGSSGLLHESKSGAEQSVYPCASASCRLHPACRIRDQNIFCFYAKQRRQRTEARCARIIF